MGVRGDSLMTEDRPVVRFAPSPNGALHLGHAYSALYTEAKARELGARLVVRIEDIDLVRSRQAFVDGILQDLAWLGLEWEQPVRRQSEHFDDYRDALARLDAMGVLYPCFATRQEIRNAVTVNPDHPLDPDGAPIYPRLAKRLCEAERRERIGSGEPHALRLDIARATEVVGGPLTFDEHERGPDGETGRVTARPALWGDVIIARKDVRTSYHLSVVVDDALQGISHVTRGQDLFHATHVHRLLQALLGLPEPRYHHHDLVRDAAGRRLSKSAKDRGLRVLRENGVTAREIRDQLGFS
jgi:glutamyl-Q tRNA(Asp) synthetase